jgi:hypothetical protein
MERETVIRRLEQHRDEFGRFGVLRLRLFGSVVRSEATAASDVDLLVDFGEAPTFDQYMDLKLYLEDLLGQRVDLVTETGLRPQLRSRVEAEAVQVA